MLLLLKMWLWFLLLLFLCCCWDVAEVVVSVYGVAPVVNVAVVPSVIFVDICCWFCCEGVSIWFQVLNTSEMINRTPSNYVLLLFYCIWINDVTDLGEAWGSRNFCDVSTKALEIKRVTMWEGVKICPNCVTSFMDDPITKIWNKKTKNKWTELCFSSKCSKRRKMMIMGGIILRSFKKRNLVWVQWRGQGYSN